MWRSVQLYSARYKLLTCAHCDEHLPPSNVE